MNQAEVRQVRQDTARVLSTLDQAQTMKGLPWPAYEGKIVSIIGVITSPVWVWDDLEHSVNPTLITEETKVKLVVSANYGTIWHDGKLIGRY